jgi:chromosome segregation ATPase
LHARILTELSVHLCVGGHPSLSMLCGGRCPCAQAELARLRGEVAASQSNVMNAAKESRSARVELNAAKEAGAAAESRVVALQAALAAKDDQIAGLDDQIRYADA